MNNSIVGGEVEVINLLGSPARFRTAIGKIFLAGRLVQCRTDSVETLSETAVFALKQGLT